MIYILLYAVLYNNIKCYIDYPYALHKAFLLRFPLLKKPMNKLCIQYVLRLFALIIIPYKLPFIIWVDGGREFRRGHENNGFASTAWRTSCSPHPSLPRKSIISSPHYSHAFLSKISGNYVILNFKIFDDTL